MILENESVISIPQDENSLLAIKSYNLNVKIYHIYIISAVATFITGLIALVVAFINPIIEKRNNRCSFRVNITDKFPYFNATRLKFYDFDKLGIFQGSVSESSTYIYRLGIIPLNNPSEDTVVFVNHFKRKGFTDDVLGFLPMRLKWSYKDGSINQNDRVIEKKIYPEIEQYCDFCFVKKSPTSTDYFLSLCGEYSGLTGKSICNCIFDSGLYEVEILIASNNSESKNKYIIEFNFNCVPYAILNHPAMFTFKSIKEVK